MFVRQSMNIWRNARSGWRKSPSHPTTNVD
jgi:hypothetical protein